MNKPVASGWAQRFPQLGTDILWSLHYMISPLIGLAADGRTVAGKSPTPWAIR